MAKLVATHLSKSFPTRSEPLVVLRDVSLEIRSGESAAIIGPSGSGKSTLLHLIGGLDAPTSGTIDLDGENPHTLAPDKLAHFRNHNVGFVFQDHHLLPQLTVLENVLIPAMAETAPTPAMIERARQLLTRVGLAARLDHRPAELSGGERQRCGIARALLMKPKLLLADEPTGNLDQKTATEVAQLLGEIHTQENAILLIVTHSKELAAIAQKRYEMNSGLLEPRS
ncbi:ABC transporter related protein [Pirellula staleyi DSM 6068]|uniref:ABC transporter related protein n=1 Tax=Pirellula staleyi (strain ATCC 27377 / DSM 6068 / ICPB 4128) TaxID=530564 RepID=D2QYV0_PIRSD|nr:ABC transporter ATP-binding protein [Pirellula staleyi]ADB16405.1 ABC transporter related protein [Pirellula staleyi DSM 6068]